MAIKDILATLDPKNDEHWTEDGLPNMRLFKPGTSRQQVTDAYPMLTRAKLAESQEIAVPHEEPAAVEPEAEAVEPEVTEADRLAEAVAAYEEAADAANEAGIERDKAQELAKTTQRAVSKAYELVERLTPRTTNERNISAYLERQKQVSGARAARAAEVRAKGFKAGDLTPVSDLDNAMSRKTARGTQRPSQI